MREALGASEEPRRDRFWPQLCTYKLSDPGKVTGFSGTAFPIRMWEQEKGVNPVALATPQPDWLLFFKEKAGGGFPEDALDVWKMF